MRRCALRSLVLLALAATAASCTAAPKTQRAIAAPLVTPQPAGEQTQPLPLSYGRAIDPAKALRKPIFVRALPAAFNAAPIATANGTAYYYDNGVLSALDLTTAAVRWHREVDAYPESFAATPHALLFQTRVEGELVYLDAANGTTRFSIPHARAAGSVDGVIFIQDYQDAIYFALDERTGRRLWKSYGGGTQVNGAPVVRNGMLLQPFVNDGAILENVLYAFDPKNGHAKWSQYAMDLPLGYRGDIAYVNSTWFPQQLDNYVPLSVAAIDMPTGKRIDEYTYAPDPQLNSATYRNSPIVSYVTGGFVYLRVNGTWYRYDAQRQPASAHPSQVQNFDIAGAFDDGALLVTDAKHAYLGYGTPTALTLTLLPDGELRSPLVRANGGAYAVIGTIVYRFNSAGTPRAIGSVRCKNGASIYAWPGNLAVLCGGEEQRFENETKPAPVLAVSPEEKPQSRLSLRSFAIPPAQGLMRQWWLGPMAPWRSSGVVITLDRGATNLAGAVGFVSKSGHLSTISIGHDLPAQMAPLPAEWPPKPSAIVYDRSGNVWFNNAFAPAIYKLDANGGIATYVVGEKQNGRGGLAIRLALGPDGEAWFARSHPTKEIARADGSRVFAVPERYGDALSLTAAGNGGFWFVTQTQLVHLSLDGTFSAAGLPSELQTPHYPPPVVTGGPGNTLWIARGSFVAQMNERGTIVHYTLPDATLSVQAMASACDGSLYVAENAPEVLRLPTNAKAFERYAIDYRQLDGLLRAPDCALWFVEGNNMPAQEQHVGTLSLTPGQ